MTDYRFRTPVNISFDLLKPDVIDYERTTAAIGEDGDMPASGASCFQKEMPLRFWKVRRDINNEVVNL